MKILIDIGHPAHVHFFKNAIWALKDKSHDVFITARDKEVSLELLDAYGFSYTNIGKNYKKIYNKFLGMFLIDYRLYKIAKKFKPDVLVGIHNPYIAQVGTLLRRRSIVFTDTEHAKLANLITFPFSDNICTPTYFKNNLGIKQVRYNGFHEIAYLHPRYFKPDSTVLSDLGLSSADVFIIIRLVSWNASHDLHWKGIDDNILEMFMKELLRYGKVFIISETEISKKFDEFAMKIPAEKIHDALYYSSLYIGEGATMAAEAGILGTPSIYISPLAGTMGNFEELEKFGLVDSFTDPAKALCKALELLKNEKGKENWNQKKENFFKDKVDVTEFIVRFIENYHHT